jgi:hypothetical protein
MIFYAEFSREKCRYTVKWVDYNGNLLDIVENVPYGTIIEHIENPKRAYDDDYHYNFIGWLNNTQYVEDDITFVALYD